MKYAAAMWCNQYLGPCVLKTVISRWRITSSVLNFERTLWCRHHHQVSPLREIGNRGGRGSQTWSDNETRTHEVLFTNATLHQLTDLQCTAAGQFATRALSLHPLTLKSMQGCRRSYHTGLQLKGPGQVVSIRPVRNIMLCSVRNMAGHSKWQNIRHIKAAKDAERSTLFSKLARQIKIAVLVGKSSDPKLNIELAHVIEVAKRANMPLARLESILKGSEAAKEAMMPFLMEAKGPGGCFILIDILTDNINRTRAELKHQFLKLGVTIQNGSAKHAFDYKGVVNVDPEASGLVKECAVDTAIEVGAEDVIDAIDENNDHAVFQFQCEPKDFYAVKSAIESKGCTLTSSGLRYVPKQKVQLSDDQLQVMAKLCEVMEEHPDVSTFYDNVE